MAVVSISREYGSGGRIVGQMVAERLGYRFIDQAVLEEIAKEAGISLQWVEEVAKEVGDWMARLVARVLESRHFIHYLPGGKTKFDEAKFRAFLTTAIRQLAAQDRAVILGRGSQFILMDHPKTLRVLVVAAENDRVNALMNRYDLDQPKAKFIAHTADKHRLNFLRGFDQGDPQDHHLYHLVLNTSLMKYEAAADLICRAVGHLGA